MNLTPPATKVRGLLTALQRLFAILSIIVLGACSHSPKADSVKGDWQVMLAAEGKPAQLCYAGAEPTSSKGTITKRDSQPYLMITRRTSGKIEVSMSSGYAYMQNSKTDLAIDGKTYRLFFRGNVAWAKGDMEDKVIIEALKKATDIQVRGVSQEGATSVDYYSSNGFAGALARVRKLCP